MPKSVKKDTLKLRHNPLEADIVSQNGKLKSSHSNNKNKNKNKSKKYSDDDSDIDNNNNENGYVDAKISKKILELAKKQQEEILSSEEEEEKNKNKNKNKKNELIKDKEKEILKDENKKSFLNIENNLNLRSRNSNENYNNDNDDDYEDEEDYNENFDDEEIEEIEEIEIDGNLDETALFDKFISSKNGFGDFPAAAPISIGDAIYEKIKEFEAMTNDQDGNVNNNTNDNSERQINSRFPPKVIEVYSKIGELLSRYRSGKLPKAFKIIPSLKNWEDVMFLTNPEEWSPQAMYQATRLFVSNLKPNQVQRFLSEILLERVRLDIEEHKTLNVHLYNALKKSLYKPSAFFKGILFPLCEDRCTTREAMIIGSVISKVGIPALHSSAALLRLAEMEYAGPTSYFIKILLDKKYALPYKVIDGCVYHFIKFKQLPEYLKHVKDNNNNDDKIEIEEDVTMNGAMGKGVDAMIKAGHSKLLGINEKEISTTSMPVIWHQSLLVFAQHYKNDITDEQRQSLLDLLRVQFHAAIGPEIRRELQSGNKRGDGNDVDIDMKVGL